MKRWSTLAARCTAAAYVAASIAVLAIGALGGPAIRAWAGTGGPGCALHALLGVPCPFCGMTRATLALGGGELDAALRFHPLAPVVLIGSIVVAGAIAIGRDAWLRRAPAPGVVLASVLAVWAVNLAAT